jgi:hypothetical protein
MGARVRETGGGSSVGVADQFNQFLSSQLQAPRTAMPRQVQGMGGPPPGDGMNDAAVNGGIIQQMSN